MARDIPSVGPLVHAIISSFAIQLSLSGLWSLQKGAFLVMKLAQHADLGSLINHASALTFPAGITGTVFARFGLCDFGGD